ncbi:outer membrane protein assembly factor BamB family protein [Nannocystis radixulma]|uniref:PQQ-binding-like beta-propeller repeat protein n=1 Tax=Nannocystis radixulma TaxID=2995305 RepID=A0ABT5B5B3_9BACT|nr:PQQ-binding-like beta-propeller repeat protein [Nannocystis radixulma]MDC0669313.1 PQQ-binding-like beta-propeller repeat protein [Nannocystis radixulma]
MHSTSNLHDIVRARLIATAAIAAALMPSCDCDPHAMNHLWSRFGAGPTNDHSVVSGPAKLGVADLTEEWQVEGQPAINSQLVTDGDAIYYGDYAGMVVARSIADGGLVWQTAVSGGSENPRVQSTPLVIQDYVYATEYLSATLFKLDRATGAIIWQRALGDASHRATGSPVFTTYQGIPLVIQGLDSDQNTPYLPGRAPEPLYTDNPILLEGQRHFTAIGRVVAVHAETGVIVWSRAVNANENEYGIGVWSTPAIDHGRIYVGTGQSYNPPSSPNACAILGLDLADGSIVQVMSFKPTPQPEDPAESCVWSAAYPGENPTPLGPAGDTDVGSSPVLHTEPVGPYRSVDLVTAMNKAGRIRSFDRDTGQLVWERTFSTTKGSVFGNPGVSYANGVIFAPVLNDTTLNSRDILDLSNGTFEFWPVFLQNAANVNTTTLVALDAATGQDIWIQQNVSGHTLGALSIGKDVVYHANFAGRLTAYDANNGDELFSAYSPLVEVFPQSSLFLNAPYANSATLVDESVFVATGIGIPSDGTITKYGAPPNDQVADAAE